jgi:hypothetical protein
MEFVDKLQEYKIFKSVCRGYDTLLECDYVKAQFLKLPNLYFIITHQCNYNEYMHTFFVEDDAGNRSWPRFCNKNEFDSCIEMAVKLAENWKCVCTAWKNFELDAFFVRAELYRKASEQYKQMIPYVHNLYQYDLCDSFQMYLVDIPIESDVYALIVVRYGEKMQFEFSTFEQLDSILRTVFKSYRDLWLEKSLQL